MDHFFVFSEPYWFVLLLVLFPMYWYYNRSFPFISYPRTQLLKRIKHQSNPIKKHLLFLLRVCAVVAMIIALARPQAGRSRMQQKSEGLDIMLVVDTSGSMKAMDFTIQGKNQDRLFVVKHVLEEFIQTRSDDRIGMVVFGTHAYAQAPLTLDHDVLSKYLEAVEIGVAGEQTAIGEAIAVAVNRMKDIEAKSKIMILLTDGSNTSGKVDPIEAANAAKAFDVKIYTIGVGSNRPVPIPTPLGYRRVVVELDEKSLTQIAEITNGKYFKASDTKTLSQVYKTIDELEKTNVDVTVHRNYEEKFSPYLWAALCFALMELLLTATRLRRFP